MQWFSLPQRLNCLSLRGGPDGIFISLLLRFPIKLDTALTQIDKPLTHSKPPVQYVRVSKAASNIQCKMKLFRTNPACQHKNLNIYQTSPACLEACLNSHLLLCRAKTPRVTPQTPVRRLNKAQHRGAKEFFQLVDLWQILWRHLARRRGLHREARVAQL